MGSLRDSPRPNSASLGGISKTAPDDNMTARRHIDGAAMGRDRISGLHGGRRTYPENKISLYFAEMIRCR